jgi:hypothetical protein
VRAQSQLHLIFRILAVLTRARSLDSAEPLCDAFSFPNEPSLIKFPAEGKKWSAISVLLPPPSRMIGTQHAGERTKVMRATAAFSFHPIYCLALCGRVFIFCLHFLFLLRPRPAHSCCDHCKSCFGPVGCRCVSAQAVGGFSSLICANVCSSAAPRS